MITMYWNMFFLVTLSIVIISAGGEICTKSNTGKQFMLAFMNVTHMKSTEIYDSTSTIIPSIILATVGSSQAVVTVSHSVNTGSTTEGVDYVIEGSTEIPFNSSFMHTVANGTQTGRSIVITSDQEISVVLSYHSRYLSVRSVVFPIAALSAEYVISSVSPNIVYGSVNQILIQSSQNSTNVSLRGYVLDSDIDINLNIFETFQFEGFKDLSGIKVTSNKPIAVFSGLTPGKTTYISNSPDNLLIEQVLPSVHGANYFVIPSFGLSSSLRVFATETDAHITYGVYRHTTQMHIYNGIYFELKPRYEAMEIRSDTKIRVVQYVSYYSRPAFMTTISAVDQFLYEYTINVPDGYAYNKVAITIPSYEFTGLMLDNKPIIHSFSIEKNSNQTVVYIDVLPGSHKLRHIAKIPFGAIVYGYSNTNPTSGYSNTNPTSGYGYNGGVKFSEDAVCPSATTTGHLHKTFTDMNPPTTLAEIWPTTSPTVHQEETHTNTDATVTLPDANHTSPGEGDLLTNNTPPMHSTIESKMNTLDKPMFYGAHEDLNKRLMQMETENASLKKRLERLEQAVDNEEHYSRRHCLRVAGIAESTDEITDRIIMDIAKDINITLTVDDIVRSHRVGKVVSGKPRDINVKFSTYKARQKMYRARDSLKDKGHMFRKKSC